MFNSYVTNYLLPIRVEIPGGSDSDSGTKKQIPHLPSAMLSPILWTRALNIVKT